MILTLLVFFVVSMLVIGASAEEAFKAGVVLPTMNVFWTALQAGIQDTVTAAGGKLVIATAQQYKGTVELASVEDMLEQQIDVLFIAPSDSVASIPAIEAANKAGVPVIELDSATKGGEFVTIVSTENYKAGKMAAEFVMAQINNSGTVGIISGAPVTAILERVKAFEDVIAQNPDVKIVTKQIMGNTIEDGTVVAENILTAFPKLDAFLCMNDAGFLGALTALQNAGKVGKVAIGAIDGMPEVVQILSIGLAPKSATVGQLPYDIGKKAVQAYLDYHAGKDVPKAIKIAPILVTKDNAKEFHW